MREPMSRPSQGGEKTATDLVLALSAGLERLQAVTNAIFDTLIVTRFEVQIVVAAQSSPVATIERVITAKADGCGNVAPSFPGKD